jgi:hypothetical protein
MDIDYTSCTLLPRRLLTRTCVPVMYTLRTLCVHLMYIEPTDDPHGRHGFLTPSIDLLLMLYWLSCSLTEATPLATRMFLGD